MGKKDKKEVEKGKKDKVKTIINWKPSHKDIKKGERLDYNNLKIIRPGTGIHPKYLTFLIGRTLLKDINKNEIIPEDAF